jgi:hypothetical protein
MSADVIRLTSHLADRDRLLAVADGRRIEADETIAGLTVDCAWFHDNWVTQGNRAIAAVAANHRLGVALADERRKVRKLEKIAGPYVEARHAASPIFSEVTGEHPLPVWRDKDETAELRILTLADALGLVR